MIKDASLEKKYTYIHKYINSFSNKLCVFTDLKVEPS